MKVDRIKTGIDSAGIPYAEARVRGRVMEELSDLEFVNDYREVLENIRGDLEALLATGCNHCNQCSADCDCFLGRWHTQIVEVVND